MADLRLLKQMCDLEGTSGSEYYIRSFILERISPYCIDIKIDGLGNIIAFRKGKLQAKKKLMLSAHMDEVGMIVTYITESGLLKFSTVGGIDKRVLIGKRVTVNGSKGVIGAKPIHLLNNDEKSKSIDIDNLYIDIGADSRDDAEKYVQLGDQVCFDVKCDITGKTAVLGKAIDDRAGCAILIDMIRQGVDYDMTFAFVVQEEIGLRGATAAAYSINPDSAIVVETTTAADVPGVSEEKQVCRLGNGPVISFMDRSTIYDREYFSLAKTTAEDKNIKYQIKQAVAGGNDAGAIHKSRGGVRTLAVSIPCRNLHSPAGVIYQEDYHNTELLVRELANIIAGGK